MNRYNTLGKIRYNVLGKISYNTEYVSRLKQLYTRLGPRPVILNKDMEQVALLENSFDVRLEQEAGGMDEITFSLPMKDSKRNLIVNEGYVQMFDTIYVIRKIRDLKKERITEVEAEAIWYDLMLADTALVKTEWESETAFNVLTDILNGTDWRVGVVEYTNRRTLKAELDKNPLELLTLTADLYGGELHFDTQDKTVDLLIPIGKETGASITVEKNADTIDAEYDTKELVTRVRAFGKNGMTIAEANNGIEFVEDFTYTDKVRVLRKTDERFTNAYHLKEYAEQLLTLYSKPRASYTIKMAELSSRAGLEHEHFFIGGIVRIYDKELSLDVNTRIMKWSYNVIEPWLTDITLESKVKGLSDLLTGTDEFDGKFASEDTVERAEMLNLSVFNYLMNSRADDGEAYWQMDGWDIDPLNGGAGRASFVAHGELGVTKTMYQTVYPSNSDTYAISFRGDTANIVKGANGRVGVEVEIEYEDGTFEKQFIELI